MSARARMVRAVYLVLNSDSIPAALAHDTWEVRNGRGIEPYSEFPPAVLAVVSMVEIHHNSTMPLNIKNPEVERLVEEVSSVTGESKTEAVRVALLERRARLRMRVTADARARRVHRFLEGEVWAVLPADQVGHPPAKAEREAILGYDSEGA